MGKHADVRGWRSPALALPLLVLLAAGCSSVAPGSRASLPSWCGTGSCEGIPADPPRTGMLGDDGTCLWLDLEGARVEPLWPPGYTARFDPLTVFDATGGEVAHGGATLTTQMLGPQSQFPDGCGQVQIVEVFFPAPRP
jgi:hypothetical protein